MGEKSAMNMQSGDSSDLLYNKKEGLLIELDRGTKIYGGRTVLKEVSLSVERGVATALIGRNGSGKSTLLAILAGLIKLSSGRWVYRSRALRIGYSPEAFPPLKLSPDQYLHSMGRIAGVSTQELKLLEAFHLEAFRGEPMAGFSKGMLQKVNLIQSLVTQPELLLLDEPMSGLDLPSQHTLIEILREQKKRGAAILFSAHEPLSVEALADHVHVLQAGSTVMRINGQENLMTEPHTYIVCTGFAPFDEKTMTLLPGYISSETVQGPPGKWALGIKVANGTTDSCLLELLRAGRSVLSVETRNGLGALEQWMDPKNTKGEAMG